MEDKLLQDTASEFEPTIPEQDQVGQEQQIAQALPEKQNDRNIRALRQQAKQLEKERDDYFRQLQDAKNRTTEQQPESTDIRDDELVEGKHLQKVRKELNEVRKELNEYKQHSSAMSAESRLKMNYPDFYTVVNDDTMQLLGSQYPELAASINSNADLYTKAASAYTLIKKFNISPDTDYSDDRDRIKENMSKPRPLSSLSPQQGDSPLTKANVFAQGLTPELKRHLLKEMQEAKKRV